MGLSTCGFLVGSVGDVGVSLLAVPRNGRFLGILAGYSAIRQAEPAKRTLAGKTLGITLSLGQGSEDAVVNSNGSRQAGTTMIPSKMMGPGTRHRVATRILVDKVTVLTDEPRLRLFANGFSRNRRWQWACLLGAAP